jgi:aspartyl-tRNA(Asn)/glutamyl-tRNA(Gln) amidotransferase subunit A
VSDVRDLSETNGARIGEPLTIAAAAEALRDGALTAEALLDMGLARIQAHDADLKACVTLMAGSARQEARAAGALLADPKAARRADPLLGITIGVKDLYMTRGVLTTGGSRVLDDYIPDVDAAAVERLRAAGAVQVAKTTTHEFAYGPFTPPTRNPWDLERIPGGSSGGSAVGVAVGYFLGALGSDTGGSIRIPAACCGVTGLKPTYGLVSRYGVITLSWSYDHAGPIARTVEDCALLLDTLAGYDPRDPDSLDAPPMSYVAGLAASRAPEAAVRGARIGVPRQYFFDGADPEVAEIVRAAIEVYRALGAEVREVDMPAELDASLFDRAYRAVQRPEATLYHQEMGWYPARADRYSPAVREALAAGEAVSPTDHIWGQHFRRALTAQMRALLADLDALAMPTLPIVAPRVDALESRIRMGDQDNTPGYALLRNNFPFDLTGQPALALPCGFTGAGLPVSLQLAAGHFNEPALLRLGHAYQRVTDWHLRIPPLA